MYIPRITKSLFSNVVSENTYQFLCFLDTLYVFERQRYHRTYQIDAFDPPMFFLESIADQLVFYKLLRKWNF